jgi:branched-chain amino acid transport system ATP-binding protein
MLEMRRVHTYYGDSHILQGVDLHVAKGTLVALLGRNGMGKTTTINSIMGFARPGSGEIIFKGTNISGKQPYDIARMGMAIVPQGRRIFRSLTVEENLTLGFRKGNNNKTIYNLESVYNMFPRLKQRSKNKGENISGGEQQMLAFGRALMTNPDFILLDEPFEGLAPEIVKDLSNRICEIKNSGLSILLVDQSIENALKLADYIYIMSKGKVVYEGTRDKIREDEGVVRSFMLV